MDDGEVEDDERPVVDDQGNEGDADATDAKRREKQKEEVRAASQQAALMSQRLDPH